MLTLAGYAPATPEESVQRYSSSIAVRRRRATRVDFPALLLLLAAPLALPEPFQPAAFLAAGLLSLLYFPVLERAYGRTPGKPCCRVRVVDMAGGRPSRAQVIIRTLLRLADVNPAFPGGLPAGIAVLSSKRRQRLGGMAAITFVPREEDYGYLTQPRGHSGLFEGSLSVQTADYGKSAGGEKE